MHPILASTLLLVACTSASPTGEPSGYASVRDRLASDSTRLLVSSMPQAGSITASHYTLAGWVQGTAMLSVAGGALVATVDDAGQLEITALDASIDPIEIPKEVFGKPAQLSDLHVALAAQPVAATTWTNDDDASATMVVELEASWAITFDGGTIPLATQRLPPIAVDVAITGGGDHVDASLALHGYGELWSWAGIVKLLDLRIGFDAATEER